MGLITVCAVRRAEGGGPKVATEPDGNDDQCRRHRRGSDRCDRIAGGPDDPGRTRDIADEFERLCRCGGNTAFASNRIEVSIRDIYGTTAIAGQIESPRKQTARLAFYTGVVGRRRR